jgi:hypothetical protein
VTHRKGRAGRRQLGWAALNGLLAVPAAGWVWLGWAFAGECEGFPADCGEWVIASTVAFAVTVATLLLWLVTGRRWWPLLALGTAALAVPAWHAAFG